MELKMKKILYFVQTVVLAVLPLAAAGQNLDPTVEVSRAYEGKLMEVHKPQLKMAVPDSVLHFDLEFDYSVTDKPYKGSYEFSPYTVEMKPSPTVHDPDKFYLKVGAGYQLHPVFDMVWSPNFKKPFRMNVYASHRSFIGNYWRLFEPDVEGGELVLSRMKSDGRAVRTWKGYDFSTRVGADGRLDWRKGLLWFDVGYQGLQQDSNQADRVNRFYDALDVRLGLASKKQEGFIHRLEAGFKLANDDGRVLHYTMDLDEDMDLKSFEYEIDASLGYILRNSGRIMLDVGLEGVSASKAYWFEGGDIDIVPHYVKRSGRWFFDLGVRLSSAPHSSRNTDVIKVDNQLLYPDVRVEFSAVRKALMLYFDLGGDAKLNTYSDLLAFNRHIDPEYYRYSWELMDVTDERISAVIGAEGRIGPHFSFDLRGGYAKYANAMMEGLYMTGCQADPVIPDVLKPGLGYGSYDKAFAAVDWLLAGESIRFDGSVEYAYTWAKEDENIRGLFMPAALKGNVSFTYDWKDRVFAGVDCGFSTERKGSVAYPDAEHTGMLSMPARIPGYADLGINLEYVVNRKFSVWARGGNLLGMTVQRNILYAERGPYFTVGICLNL